jgi:hypothetical protein
LGLRNHLQIPPDSSSETLGYGWEVISASQHDTEPSPSPEVGRNWRGHSVRFWVRVGVIVALVVVVGSVVWFATRVIMVKSELEASQVLVEDLQTQATNFDLSAITQTSSDLQDHASHAAAGTRDITWRVAEVVPFVGPNLKAVRAIAESIDDIVSDVAVPAIDIVDEVSKGNGDGGGMNLAPLGRAQEVAATAKSVLAESQKRLDSIDTSATVGPVSSVVDQMDGVLVQANEALAKAEPMISASADIIGQNGKRTYLLAFQNNAESTALGGSAAQHTLLTVENGTLQIAGQASSGDFNDQDPVDVQVDQSALDLYGDFLIDHINTSTTRPDFPTAATIMAAFWQRDHATKIDGVISVDPIALGLILRAIGPVDLASGDVLTSDNAVSLLVNEIYFRYDSYVEPEKVDGFFADVASTVVGRLTGGGYNFKDLAGSVAEGIDNGSIMMWSAVPSEQALLDGLRVQGVMPKDNTEQTSVGVYYRDSSASKIDYYLETATNTTSDVCTNPENPTFTTTVTLHSTLTREQALALPDYVKSFPWGADKFQTEIFVYGPVGATSTTSTVDLAGVGTEETNRTDDLGRPVVAFAAFLAPGETTTVTVSFTGAPGVYGPMKAMGTPMINPTQNTINPVALCG